MNQKILKENCESRYVQWRVKEDEYNSMQETKSNLLNANHPSLINLIFNSPSCSVLQTRLPEKWSTSTR
uniref:Uncharacterized protein n=1 Tax=Rhizophora mucronata TaxID=61149 RepID=A0A2P2QRP3_RHIMU